MNLLKTIIERLNQRVEVANIFDKQFGLCELNANGNDKAWVHYIGNGQAEVVTNFDAKQGTLFWAKRGKVTVVKTEAYRMSGCKQLYITSFPLTAYAVVRKSHLPCDAEDAQDWLASRIYKLTSGTDPLFKQSIGVINYEVVPSGYINEIKTLTANYEWACVSVDFDIQVVTTTEDGCYDTCATGDIPLPDLQPCTPCLTEVAVDGVTIIGNGTAEDPLSAIGAGGGAIVVQDEGVEVSPVATTINFTGDGVTASLTSPGVVEVNVTGGGGGGVSAVSGTAPIASSGGATPAISISQASTSTDGYLSQTDWDIFNGKQDPISAGTDISIVANAINNTAPDQVVVLTAGTDIGISGTYPNFTIDNTAPSLGGTVTSVDLTMPAAFTVTGNPVTSAGTLAVTAAGVSAQYIRGDGSLDTFPSALPPSGAASGDLSGTYPSPEVHKIHGVDMQSGTPTADDLWIYGGSPAKWQHGKIKTINSTTLIGTGNITTGTVTSVAALTLGTSGTDLSSSVANGTTTPVVTLDVPTASAANRGALSAADWTTFNGKQDALVSGTNIKTINSTSILGSGNLTISSISVFKNTTDGAASSGTSQTFSQSVLVPGNSVTLGSVLEFKLRGKKTGANNQYIIRLYANTTNNLSGTPILLMTMLSTLTTALSLQITRTGAVKNATTNTEMLLATTNNLVSDFANSTFSAIAVDWTSDKYLVGSVTNVSPLDSSIITLISMTIL
jgi:hypothetical protein